MIAGARVEVAPYKRDPHGFRAVEAVEAGRAGLAVARAGTAPGRPGWHIECSAMAWKHLGDVFDIHGGGIDLIFPHHENEIAQSRCAHRHAGDGEYWMHNGFLQVEGEKMSKSLGNFVTIRELLADWPGEVLRLNMLKTHYRSPIDWTLKGLEESAKTLDDWYRVAADVSGGQPCRRRDRGAVRRSQHAADDRRAARLAEQRGVRQRTRSRRVRGSLRSARLPVRERGGNGRAASSRRAASMPTQIDSLIAERTAARARKGLQGIRPHPRRTRRDGRRAQGFQGRHHLGDRAMTPTRFPTLALLHLSMLSRSLLKLST